MKDKYDEAIDWLVEHADDDPRAFGSFQPSMIKGAWAFPTEKMSRALVDAHCLFQITGNGCCCLTQVRARIGSAPTMELTREIAADVRIPSDPSDLKYLRGDELRAALEPFAEWQRRLDPVRESLRESLTVGTE